MAGNPYTISSFLNTITSSSNTPVPFYGGGTGIPTSIPSPQPTYVFNIVIIANGKALPLDSDDLAEKIGKAIHAAMATKDAQELVDDLAE